MDINMGGFTTPVVLALFNRPELTAQVFAVIRQLRPTQLFLIADGPRSTHPEDVTKCQAARQVVAQVDWPCTVRRAYSETNMGCAPRVTSGLDWVFSQVDAAIILEDDTLPDASFFPFCQELLVRYQHDERIAYISGHNSLGKWEHAPGSYFACRHGSIWGWATWKRAWQHYDLTLAGCRPWDIENILLRNMPDPEHAAHQIWLFRHSAWRSIDTWDMQWTLLCLLQGNLCLIPTRNLVRNLGFQREATHTIDPLDIRRDVACFPLPMPLVHPEPTQLHVPDDQFGRWLFLLVMLTSYKDVRTLRLWQRLLDKSPSLTLPGLNEGITHVLTPLRHPAETLQLLTYWQTYLPHNERLQQAIQTFQAISKQAPIQLPV